MVASSATTAAQARRPHPERRGKRGDHQPEHGEQRNVTHQPVRASSNRCSAREREDDEPDCAVDDLGWVLLFVHGRLGGRPAPHRPATLVLLITLLQVGTIKHLPARLGGGVYEPPACLLRFPDRVGDLLVCSRHRPATLKPHTRGESNCQHNDQTHACRYRVRIPR